MGSIAHYLAAEICFRGGTLFCADDGYRSGGQEKSLPELAGRGVNQMGEQRAGDSQMAEADNDSVVFRLAAGAVAVNLTYVSKIFKNAV